MHPSTESSGTEKAVIGSTANAMGMLAAQVITGLALIITARRTAVDEFGAFAAGYAISLILGGILDFGSSQRMTRTLAKNAERDSFRSWLVRRSLFQAPVVLLAVAFIEVTISPGPSAVVSLLLGMQALTYTVSLGALSAVRATISPAIASWLAAAGNVVLLIAAVASPPGRIFMAVAAAAAVSWLISAIAGLALTRTQVGGRPWRARNPWAGSLSFGLAAVAYFESAMHVPLLAVAGTSADAGTAAAVQRWTMPLVLLSSAYSLQIFPDVSAAPDDATALRLLRSVWFPVVAGVFLGLGVFVLAPELVQLLLGSSYESSVIVLRLYVIAAIPVLLAQPLSVLLQARGAEDVVAATSIALGLVSLLGVVALASVWGAVASPIMSFVYGCMMVALLGRRALALGT